MEKGESPFGSSPIGTSTLSGFRPFCGIKKEVNPPKQHKIEVKKMTSAVPRLIGPCYRKPMSRYLMLLIVVLAGAGIPVQVASNHRLEKAVQSPALSVALSFSIGALAMLALTWAGAFGHARFSGAASAPWWAWVGGLLSATIVIASILALPQSGAGSVSAATVFGQLVAATALDHFGWLGVPQIRFNGWRLCGVLLLFGGALLMQRK